MFSPVQTGSKAHHALHDLNNDSVNPAGDISFESSTPISTKKPRNQQFHLQPPHLDSSLFDAEYSDDVRELMSYADETAGGLMTSEYVAVQQNFTAQQTIEHLRVLEPEAETIYYVYVVDIEEQLVGVISLRDLIVAKPDDRISQFMKTNAFSVWAKAPASLRYEPGLILADENFVIVHGRFSGHGRPRSWIAA